MLGTDYPLNYFPEYFVCSLDFTFMTLSQGGAGVVDISSSFDRAVPIYSVADGVKTLEDPGTIVGVEDGAAIRLSVKVAREDTSENITQVKLTGLNADFGISHNVDTPNITSNVVCPTRVDGQLTENLFNVNYITRSASGINVEFIIDIQGQASTCRCKFAIRKRLLIINKLRTFLPVIWVLSHLQVYLEKKLRKFYYNYR